MIIDTLTASLTTDISTLTADYTRSTSVWKFCGHAKDGFVYKMNTLLDAQSTVQALKPWDRFELLISITDMCLSSPFVAGQWRFTKRIPGLATTTYYSRLKKINLESLELRRLRADLALVYKILFGVIHIKSNKLFTLRNQPQLCGHSYTLSKPRCNRQARQWFFNIRVIILWNSLPADITDFSSLRKICSSVTKDYLVNFCTVNFI